MNRLLLHACCGPCTLYPLKLLKHQGVEVTGYFYNPNIHPFREFERRVEALGTVAEKAGLRVVWDGAGYGLSRWLEVLGGGMRPEERCPECYRMRLEATARKAVELGFPAISTTLLYSRYQRHEQIRKIGEQAAASRGITFYYEDFRQGWDEGVALSREMGIYRQPYCGCIFSEAERYAKREKRLRDRLK